MLGADPTSRTARPPPASCGLRSGSAAAVFATLRWNEPRAALVESTTRADRPPMRAMPSPCSPSRSSRCAVANANLDGSARRWLLASMSPASEAAGGRFASPRDMETIRYVDEAQSPEGPKRSTGAAQPLDGGSATWARPGKAWPAARLSRPFDAGAPSDPTSRAARRPPVSCDRQQGRPRSIRRPRPATINSLHARRPIQPHRARRRRASGGASGCRRRARLRRPAGPADPRSRTRKPRVDEARRSRCCAACGSSSPCAAASPKTRRGARSRAACGRSSSSAPASTPSPIASSRSRACA